MGRAYPILVYVYDGEQVSPASESGDRRPASKPCYAHSFNSLTAMWNHTERVKQNELDTELAGTAENTR